MCLSRLLRFQKIFEQVGQRIYRVVQGAYGFICADQFRFHLLYTLFYRPFPVADRVLRR